MSARSFFTLGYTGMCGHATIALGRYAVDHGIVKGVSPETIVKIQCPCGLVTARVEYTDGKAGAVKLESMPCSVIASDLTVNLGMCICVAHLVCMVHVCCVYVCVCSVRSACTCVCV